MICKHCKSENLVVVKSGMHNKLVCGDCLKFQKFLSKEDLKTFQAITNSTEQPDASQQANLAPCEKCGKQCRPICPECDEIERVEHMEQAMSEMDI